jgi:hypothetical protein
MELLQLRCQTLGRVWSKYVAIRYSVISCLVKISCSTLSCLELSGQNILQYVILSRVVCSKYFAVRYPVFSCLVKYLAIRYPVVSCLVKISCNMLSCLELSGQNILHYVILSLVVWSKYLAVRYPVFSCLVKISCSTLSCL